MNFHALICERALAHACGFEYQTGVQNNEDSVRRGVTGWKNAILQSCFLEKA